LELLGRLGMTAEEISLSRVNAAGPVEAGRQRWLGSKDSLVWAEVVDTARENARLFAQYLVFMAIAGMIAAIGVIGKNEILIVGAMAVSPDLLPVSAACVGIVGKRPRLIARAVATLIIGLLLGVMTAWLITLVLTLVGYLPSDFEVGKGGIGTLATVNVTTFIIAFVAGIAGMLAFETRASAAVGVAISVTTIPAAALSGATIAIGEFHDASGALTVLAVNVAMLLAGGTLALMIQRLINAGRAAGGQSPAGWNSSTTLPEGSSSKIWRPPGPVTMSLRKLTPASRSRVTSVPMSATMRWIRFQPPGLGLVPSGMGRPAELAGPLSSSRRFPRVTSAKAGTALVRTSKPRCSV
jgi:uncharacterized hydrophobic protein (TIGR00271 family)